MSMKVSRELSSFFREEAGEALRVVAHYDTDSTEFIYLRDDLADGYSETDFERAFEIHRRDKEAAAHQESVIDAGRHHCTLRVYDGAIVFNFAQTGKIGTIISLDPDIGRNLLSFIMKCLHELDIHSQQEVSVPKWVLTE